jgi:hypothetical protein
MNNEVIKTELTKADIICKLYKIQNVADLIWRCPESDADTCILQGAASVIVNLISNLIDEVEELETTLLSHLE